MIVVDSSALVAILLGEPEADRLTARIGKARPGERWISVASYVETGAVLAGRDKARPQRAIRLLDNLLSDMGVELVTLEAEQAHAALDARIRFGRGFGAAAKLNFGDCFSYALAKSRNATLLYIGNDFDKTGIKPALKLNP
jgi:ribonuclease VapC